MKLRAIEVQPTDTNGKLKAKGRGAGRTLHATRFLAARFAASKRKVQFHDADIRHTRIEALEDAVNKLAEPRGNVIKFKRKAA